MQFEFSNINTQYKQTNTDVIAAITKENASASKSDIDSVYNSGSLNLDAAVLSISTQGSAKINAMLSKSIQLRASVSNPSLTVSDRQNVNKELSEIRREIDKIRNEDTAKIPTTPTIQQTSTNNDCTESVDVAKMMEESTNNILKYAEESMQSQIISRDKILGLL